MPGSVNEQYASKYYLILRFSSIELIGMQGREVITKRTNYLNSFSLPWLNSCGKLSNTTKQGHLENGGHDFVYSCRIFSVQ